ncbi:MAG TPA: type VI secretion system baseplate subunit TssE [Deltaproteobacteria bacterium]|nr:type VI secretion system baseplate subunit TssE [Deltaproteobacteria bacterium]HOM28860.1 type VI secretion system baseplate subunit TssE [Deltaproteobacteria bacterium]HPP80955.1 type VI secretion system baseplate subunit TssE [Deltaproteobacteria bacterium]
MRPSEENLLASVLDRLVDEEPEVSFEPVPRRLLDMRRVRELVVRDLENLLNTRCTVEFPDASFKEVGRSVFVYGIRDYTSLSPRSAAVRKSLRQDIERAIAVFEPRLRNVKVHLEAEQKGHSLRFRITALIVVEPEKEPVQFDTLFDINRSQYTISR